MIVIYTQDKTRIYNSAKEARGPLIGIYGDKLGSRAYEAAIQGKAYRENGDPLVKVVNAEEARQIREREVAIGMM